MEVTNREEGARRVASDHAEVRRLVKVVERGLSEGDEVSPQQLSADLEELVVHVRAHFAFEEEGGLFGERRGVDAGTLRQVQELFAQHRDLLSRLEEASRRVSASAGAGLSPPLEVRVDLRELFSDMLRHEYTENRLFQQVLYQDLGGCD